MKPLSTMTNNPIDGCHDPARLNGLAIHVVEQQQGDRCGEHCQQRDAQRASQFNSGKNAAPGHNARGEHERITEKEPAEAGRIVRHEA